MVTLRGFDKMAGLQRFSALRHRDYRIAWIASMLSGGAMWTFIVASSWMVFNESDQSTWVGIITFASMLPFLLVSPIAGLMGDALDRKMLVSATMVMSAVSVIAMAGMSFIDILELWHVAVFAFVLGSTRAFQEPPLASLIPNLVPREDLLNALVLAGATRHGARFFGLLIASPMLAIDMIGVNGVLVMSGSFHILAAWQMFRISTISRGETDSKRGVVRNIFEGLIYIYKNQVLAVFMLLVAFHCALVMSFESVLPILSSDILGATDGSTVGYLFMGFGAGALVGMFLLAGVRSDRLKGRTLFWTGITSGISPILLAVVSSVPLAVFSSAAMGASQGVFMALTSTYVQSIAPDRLRSRISSLYILHAGGIMAFANLGYGFMADAFSAPPILLVTAVIFLVIVVGLSRSQPVLRQVYRTGDVVLG